MNRTRAAFIALMALAIGILLAGPAWAGFTSQRDQIGITVIVNVTPAVAYHPPDAAVGAPQIASARLHRAKGSDVNVDLLPGTLLAQSTSQKALKVSVQVTPNPNATLLYSNTPSVSASGVAGGAPIVLPCAYTVTVDRGAGLSWTLNDGLSADFSGNFNGTNVANNTYPSPGPANATSTPFVVYADDGNKWYALPSKSGKVTYCVDLTIAIPAAVPGGTYSTTAVYTVYF